MASNQLSGKKVLFGVTTKTGKPVTAGIKYKEVAPFHQYAKAH